MLAEYIQYKYIYPTDTCFPTQRPKGAQTPSNCHISSNCWQNIYNTNIYIQLTHVPQPSARKGAQTPSKCHIFPNCWQCISNINVYSSKSTFPHPAPEGRTNTLQLTYISQLLAQYIQYLCIMSYNFWVWCQIVHGAKLLTVPNCPRCQIVLEPNCPRCQIDAVPNCSVPICTVAKLSVNTACAKLSWRKIVLGPPFALLSLKSFRYLHKSWRLPWSYKSWLVWELSPRPPLTDGKRSYYFPLHPASYQILLDMQWW